ncbi:DUF1405 domain-containing protein [Candidatus Gracilibacteria bacterium]|nr:DUF1405 domain-containing protein [Candidatus Gracilibacteria bacterium]
MSLVRWVMRLILDTPLLFWAAVVANGMGVILGGWLWYGWQIAAAPFWAWLFIPDCPLAALLGTIGLFAVRAGRRWPWFYALSAFACIKYGIWTLAFWLRYWTEGGPIDAVGLLMFVTHIGLICMGVLFIPYMEGLAIWKRATVIGWFTLSIFVDYGLSNYALSTFGTAFHPALPTLVPASFALMVAMGVTIVASIALLLLPKQLEVPQPRAGQSAVAQTQARATQRVRHGSHYAVYY